MLKQLPGTQEKHRTEIVKLFQVFNHFNCKDENPFSTTAALSSFTPFLYGKEINLSE